MEKNIVVSEFQFNDAMCVQLIINLLKKWNSLFFLKLPKKNVGCIDVFHFFFILLLSKMSATSLSLDPLHDCLFSYLHNWFTSDLFTIICCLSIHHPWSAKVLKTIIESISFFASLILYDTMWRFSFPALTFCPRLVQCRHDAFVAASSLAIRALTPW